MIEITMPEIVPASPMLVQFGEMQPGLAYRTRPAAHGVAMDKRGLIAIVQIGARKGMQQYDLPGGGVDPGETEQAALIREFLEETGLQVQAGRLLARTGQYWLKDGADPRNSLCGIFEAILNGEPQPISEPDHVLLWLPPDEALVKLRHEAHAWALRQFLRGG